MSDTERVHVLHVDDEPSFSELVADMLEREDDQITVETATSASEGLDRLADTDFDCVVSDYDMPGQNGIEFLEHVREEYSDLPFILYTGKGSEEVASDAISAGATDYLQKGSGTHQYELLANRILNTVEQYRNKKHRATLERIRTLVNDINQALIRAPSRQQIESHVCNILADSDPYRFTVFADVEPHTMQIEPSTWAGTGEAFLDDFAMSVAEGAPGRQAPGGLAFHEREIAVAQDIQTDPAYEEWRDLALEHGFQSLAVVPLEYESEFYGLLAVFADRPHAFDESEQEVLEELGDDIAHAIHAQEIRDQLREERAFIDQALDTLDDIFYVVGTDGELRRWNERLSEISGYTDEALADRQAVDLFPEDERELIIDAIERTLDTGSVITEATLLTADGDPIPYEFTGARLTDTEDNLLGLVGIGRDLTERKERERELERYETIAQTVQDGICVLNRDSEFVMVNDAFVELTGYSRNELLGSHESLVRPEELNQTFDELQESLETGSQVESIEMVIERAGGSTRVIDARYGQFSHGGRGGRVGAWRDITDQKEREQELQRYQEYTERMRDAIDDLFYVHDTEGNLQQWNHAFSEVTGYSDEEIESMNGIEFVPEEHRERTAAAIEKVFETGHARLEAPLLTKSGETIPYEYAAARVEHPEGDPRLVGVGRDISERKKREQELRESERRYRTLAENFPNGAVFLLDENLRYQVVSGAGFDPIETAPDDLIGNTVDEVDPFSEEVVDLLETTFSRALEGEKTTTELTYEGHTYDLRAVPVRDQEDTVTQVLAITQDITERKEQERELKRQNERLEEFASIVSHDLRNPLNVASGQMELAREECECEYLDAVATAHDRMNALIDDLLTLAREGDRVSEPVTVDLGTLCENCWRNVETADATVLSLINRTILADRSRLAQLLENLFRNAVEHGGGDVTITVGELNGGFYVEDDGPGIPQDERDAAFDAGYSTTEDGTGFGLSIVKQVVEAHGWDIRVTEGTEGGARFEVIGVDFAE